MSERADGLMSWWISGIDCTPRLVDCARGETQRWVVAHSPAGISLEGTRLCSQRETKRMP